MTETGKELERIAFKTNIRTAAEIGLVLRELPALLSANAGMKEALEFYGSECVEDRGDGEFIIQHAFFADAGKRARDALSALPTGEAVKRYREKSVVIEAVRVPEEGGEFTPEEYAWLPENAESQHDGSVLLHFRLQSMTARPGDWIVKRNGNFYPLEPAIFEHIYEPISGEARTLSQKAEGDAS